MYLPGYMKKRAELKPTAEKIAEDLSKKGLTVSEASIVVELLSVLVKPEIQDKKLSDFI